MAGELPEGAAVPTMTDLDIEQPDQLRRYLRKTGRLDRDEHPKLTVLAGGVSNRTVLVERAAGEAWVIKQALAKLRVTVDWFSSPLRIEREALGLRWLAQLAPPGSIVPLLFEDQAHHLLAMAAVPTPHENWKTLLLAGVVVEDHVRQFANLLATVHCGAWEQHAQLEPIFRDRGFFESLRLEPYYAYAAEQVPEARRFLLQLMAEIRANPITLVHGDFSPKNVLVHHDRLVLLDHEVIHWGDPAFDLGFGLTHLLSKAHHLPQHRAVFVSAIEEFWLGYVGGMGDLPWAAALEPRAVRATLGCLLARVAGRSPLEYLNAAERSRQRAATLRLMSAPPTSVAALARRFIEEIDDPADD